MRGKGRARGERGGGGGGGGSWGFRRGVLSLADTNGDNNSKRSNNNDESNNNNNNNNNNNKGTPRNEGGLGGTSVQGRAPWCSKPWAR